MKYKVGDKVRVRRDLEERYDCSPVVNSIMAEMRGNILTIRTEIETYGYEAHENPWNWSDDMLESADSAKFPSFTEIVEKAGIKKGDRVLINGHNMIYNGESLLSESNNGKIKGPILGQSFKILPKPKTGAEILAHLKELRGDWEPDWKDYSKDRYFITYSHYHKEWIRFYWRRCEVCGALIFNYENIDKALEYLNSLTEEESMNLLKEMRI